MSAPEQLGFDQMPRRLLRATPTRLTSWLDCPRRYRFTYLDRPPPAKGYPWAHNSLGASVHSAIAGWWKLRPDRRTPEAAGDLLEHGWLTEGFRDPAQSARWRKHARAMVEDYVAGLDPYDEPIGVERTVALRTSILALSGRADRIDERYLDGSEDDEPEADEPEADDGSDSENDSADDERAGAERAGAERSGSTELVIVDYKTGRRPLSTADARGSLALAVYALAAQTTLRRPCRRVELHHLPSRTVVGWTHTDDSLRRHLRRADSIGEEAADAEVAYPALSGKELDEVFPPRPSPQCHWCDFAAHCPPGRDAFPAKRSWEGLDPSV